MSTLAGSNALRVAEADRVHVDIHGLTVGATSSSGTATILDSVSFLLPHSNMMAIMGGLGAGKTTLLNVLAQRTTVNSEGLQFGGSMAYGVALGSSRISTAYMLQEDTFLPGLTLLETLQYQAELRLGTASAAERRELIASLLLLLQLQHRQHEMVRSFSGHINLSGGEQRRTSLAIQLLSRPQLLFLDEPTTGLDTLSALTLVLVLRKLASPEIGITIILLIHQPRREVVQLFDQLCVLARGGRLVYYGSLADSAPHFEHLQAQGVVASTAHADAFDVLNRIMAMLVKDTSLAAREEQSARLADALVAAWNAQHPPTQPVPAAEQKEHFQKTLRVFKPQNPLPFHRELYVLVRRNLLVSVRDTLSLAALYVGSILLGIFSGWLFFKPTPDLAGIRTITSTLYAALETIGFAPLAMELERLWQHEGVFFFKEYREKCVSVPGFVSARRVAKLVVEDVPICLFYAVTAYFMAGLRRGPDYTSTGDGSYFGIFFAIVLLVETTSMSLATLCFSLGLDFAISAVFINILYQLQNSGCGYFVNAKSMPVYVRWVKYIAFFWYAFGALALNQYTDWVGKCPYDAADPRCKQYTGNWQLDVLGYPRGWTGAPIGYLVLWLIGANVLAIISLSFRNYDVVFAKRKKNRIGGDEDAATSKEYLLSTSLLVEKRADIGLNVRDLSLAVKVRSSQNVFQPKEQRILLNNVSANFRSSAVNAIMGPLGSGKTTLLNMLAHRLSGKFSRTGTIYLNNVQDISPSEIAQISAYVTQNDNLLIPHLTVRETLYYQARLRLPVGEHPQIPFYIARLLRQTGLVDCADTPIGSASLKGVSGGEKRRVLIAIQLLSRPKILFLDEPTSGLDSATSASIVTLLCNLAADGTTIVSTIHQPSNEIFSQFDSLVLLAKGGHVIYDGPVNTATRYFASAGYTCAAETNEADFCLDLVSLQFGEEKETSAARIEHLIAHWGQTDALYKELQLSGTAVDLKMYRATRVPWWPAFKAVCRRQWIVSWRATDVVFARVFTLVALAVVYALFFSPLKHTQDGISDRLGLTQCVLNLYFCGLINNLSLYPSQRDLFHQEYRDGTYGAGVFTAAYTLVELPFEAVTSVVFSAIVVFATGLPRTPLMFFAMVFCSFACVNCGESSGIFFASLFKHIGLVTNVLTSLFTIAIFMAGTMSLHMLSFLKAWNYLNPTKYVVHICTNLGFAGLTFSCPEGTCSLNTGADVLSHYGLRANLSSLFGALVACFVAYRAVSVVAVHTRAKWFL